ncbi:MAG: metallophosphoesterase family protein [Pirellulales bacterium]|nr:metallophosphoesterase family protein [Pirellulales bacterium]
MRFAWLTDIHLNFLDLATAERFFAAVRETQADAIVLTGDIGEARSLVPWLERIDDALRRPIYFVLGNHDFYGGSIAEVRQAAARLQQRRPNLVYLTASSVVPLTEATALVGDDGWADARLGNYETSYVMMNDYRLIEELAPYSKRDRWAKLQRLGDEAADHVRTILPPALAAYQNVILATHVPPLREACWHEGQLSDDEWAPHFTCRALGDVILETMRRHPHRHLTVYCGHTHSSGICQPLPNVTIHTGGAKYGFPAVQELIDVA